MVVFDMINKYLSIKMINNMTGYVGIFFYKMVSKKGTRFWCFGERDGQKNGTTTTQKNGTTATLFTSC